MPIRVNSGLTNNYILSLAKSTSSLFAGTGAGVFTHSLSTAIKQIENNGLQISIYPNPFSSSITIDKNSSDIENLTLKIFNADGQIIDVVKLSQDMNTLDLKYLKSGLYYFELVNEKGYFSAIMIRQ
jgi:hypothetical protein